MPFDIVMSPRRFSTYTVDGILHLRADDEPIPPKEPKIKTPEEALEAFNKYVGGAGTKYPDWIPTDWEMCSILGRKAPPDRLISVWSAGREVKMLSDYHKTKNTFVDYEGRIYLRTTDRPVTIYDEEGREKIISSFTVESLEHSRKLFNNMIARGVHYYTTFATGFRDHSAGNSKTFVKPKGEAIGIEIEVNFQDIHKGNYTIPAYIAKLLFSKWMLENYPNWICERDGSLEGEPRRFTGGLEMISPPLEPTKLYADLEVILPKCVSMGGIGHKATTAEVAYGIHITQNLYGPFAVKEGDRYTYLINHPDLREFWQAASRRSGAKFDKYCGFKEIRDVEAAMETQSDNHYRAVFPRGKGAVETRIFRSNLDVNKVKCIVELCLVTMRFCKNPKMTIDPDIFAIFLKKECSPELKKYINLFGGWAILENEDSADL